MAARYYVRGSKLADVGERKKLTASAAAVAASGDTMIALARMLDGTGRELYKRFQDKVEAVQTSSASRIAQARFAVYGANEYPDATFTLRLTYAAVKGYTNAEGKKVPWASDFAGLYGRATGVEPTNVIALTSRLLAESPGTIAGPVSPPNVAAASESNRNPPSCFSRP